MAILSVVQGSTRTQAELRAGSNSVGRADGNDLQIPDPSVSGRHCEMQSLDGCVRVRDLGSTNGTYLGQQKISEALVYPGQQLRLGNVVVTLEGGGQPPEPLPGEPPVPPAVPTHQCQKCGAQWAAEALVMQKIGPKQMPFCPSCRGLCEPISSGKPAARRSQSDSFFGALPEAFKYPFKKNGLILLICGTALYLVLDFLSISRLIRVFAAGYLFAYMQKIIVTTAAGDQEMPSWPDFTEWYSDILHPFLLLTATGAAAFGPGIVCTIFGQPLLGGALLLLGVVYFPMALLSVAMADSMSGLNPLFVFASIVRIPGEYLISIIFLGLVVGLNVAGDFVAESISIPLVPTIVMGFFELLFLTIEMRVLGLLYYCNRTRLQWL